MKAAMAAAVLGIAVWVPPVAASGYVGRIIWVSDRGGRPDLYTMDGEGGHVVRLTDDPHVEEYPKVSPDRSKVAFISNRSGKRELWIMPFAARASARQVTHSPADLEVMEPDWSPDGRVIAYNVISTNLRDPNATRVVGEIWRVDAQGTSPTRLIEAPGLHFNPVFSADGKRLLVVANDYETYFDHPLAPFLFDAGGGGRRRLSRGFDAHAAWCGPEHVVVVNFPADTTAAPAVWRLALADTTRERISPVEWKGSPRLPNTDPSGRWLIFTADPDNKPIASGKSPYTHYDVFKLDLETRAMDRLTEDGHMDEGAWWY
jgi:Tol biopolymer transport system component